MDFVFVVYPTATPTPSNYEYVIATGCVSALLILLLGTMAILIYLLWYQHRLAEQAPYQYTGAQEPLVMFTTPPSTTSYMLGPSIEPAPSKASESTVKLPLTAADYSDACSSLSFASKQPYLQHSVC